MRPPCARDLILSGEVYPALTWPTLSGEKQLTSCAPLPSSPCLTIMYFHGGQKSRDIKINTPSCPWVSVNHISHTQRLPYSLFKRISFCTSFLLLSLHSPHPAAFPTLDGPGWGTVGDWKQTKECLSLSPLVYFFSVPKLTSKWVIALVIPKSSPPWGVDPLSTLSLTLSWGWNTICKKPLPLTFQSVPSLEPCPFPETSHPSLT